MPFDAAPSHDLLFAPAHRLAAMIAAGDLSARELVGAVVARARAVAPALNCFAVPLFEEALEAAREADARQARGDPLGPLHGVPVTVKDGVATAGHPLTVGSRAEAATVATTDDPVWTRLRDAGAILLGKTTTPEYLHKIVTDSPLYGVTRNPWSLAHSPGGSSGGAAAALAAGVGPVAVGSDGGGSLRCPASCTNTLALKPTMGRVPHAGIPDAFGYYSTMGPMTRDLRDLALMLSVMSGPHEADAASLRVPPFAFDDAMKRPSGRLRVGWLADPGGYRTAPEVTGLTAAALESLADGHIDLVAVDPGLLDGAFEPYRTIVAVACAARARGKTEAQLALWSDSFRALAERGLACRATDLEGAQGARTRLFRRVQGAFADLDVIATPTLTRAPGLVEAEGSVGSEAYAAWAAALYPFNLTGHPAISVPCGFSADGLPVGVQFVAPWYEERRLIALAAALEAARPWSARRPAL